MSTGDIIQLCLLVISLLSAPIGVLISLLISRSVSNSRLKGVEQRMDKYETMMAEQRRISDRLVRLETLIEERIPKGEPRGHPIA